MGLTGVRGFNAPMTTRGGMQQHAGSNSCLWAAVDDSWSSVCRTCRHEDGTHLLQHRCIKLCNLSHYNQQALSYRFGPRRLGGHKSRICCLTQPNTPDRPGPSERVTFTSKESCCFGDFSTQRQHQDNLLQANASSPSVPRQYQASHLN